MNAAAGINAYKNVRVESSVLGTDPHGLIAMLFQGALVEIDNARSAMIRKETAAKGKSTSKAIAIIGEGLNASLDKTVGGELAHSLSALYTYMVTRLVDANYKNDVTALDEVTGLLTELKAAWDGIRPQATQFAPQTMASRTYGSA